MHKIFKNQHDIEIDKSIAEAQSDIQKWAWQDDAINYTKQYILSNGNPLRKAELLVESPANTNPYIEWMSAAYIKGAIDMKNLFLKQAGLTPITKSLQNTMSCSKCARLHPRQAKVLCQCGTTLENDEESE